MRVGIVLYPNCSLWSAIGPCEMLRRANKMQTDIMGFSSAVKQFQVSFVAANRQYCDSILQAIPIEQAVVEGLKFDLVIVPGFESKPDFVWEHSANVISWLQKQYNAGTQIASLCTGSMMLARAGFLLNRVATTHWMLKEWFQAKFPDVSLDLSQVIIDHGDVLMSGSATSFQNLILMLVERFMGRTIAVALSKVYLIEIQKDPPSSFMNLLFTADHNDEPIRQAQNYIREHSCEMLSVEDLARMVALNRRTFLRRFKKATNDTPLQYLHKCKVERAKCILENQSKTFEEIAFMLGYEDVCAFRKVFVKHTGIASMRYRSRYQRIKPVE